MQSIDAVVVLASRNVATGDEIVTFELTMPKWMVAQFNTHRAISRNSMSSRAVPPFKIRAQVLSDPFSFTSWGARNKGMEAGGELTGWRRWLAQQAWLTARYPALLAHWTMEKACLQKEACNRILEPWMWTKVLATATEWNNFYKLRLHHSAQPEFQCLASKMMAAHDMAVFQELEPGEWHLPYVGVCGKDGTGFSIITSTARCARVSRNAHETGKSSTIDKDKRTHDMLVGSSPEHWSPLEHPAQAMETSERCGNLVGWKQYRKFFATENGGDYETNCLPGR